MRSCWFSASAWLLLAVVACSASDGTSRDESSGGSTSSGGTGGAGGTGGTVLIDGGGTAGGDGSAEDCNDSVDIVFVMDVSTSMGPFLTKLAQEISVVDQAIKQLSLNAPPQYGLVVFVDDTQFINFGQPYADLGQLKADFESWAAFTSFNQQVSGLSLNSTWPENSLDAIYLAASGFAWRPETQTLRMIIHTTDDTFWNGPTTGDGLPIQHGYAETVALLQQNKIRLFTFAAKLGGQCECLDVSGGWFTPYSGQPAIPTATGGGAWELGLVMNNQISLSNALTTAVEDSRCKPYPTPR